MTLVHATANIKSNPLMSAPHADADIEKVAGLLAGASGSIGWQEIAPDYYRADVKDEADLATFWPGGSGNSVPISWTRDLTDIAHGFVKTHDGKAGITPQRFVVWVVLEDAQGEKFWHVNTHFISSAWSDTHPATKAWRQDRWNEHAKALRGVVRAMLFDHGPNGVVTGDFNRSKYVDPELVALGGTYHWLPKGTFGAQFYDYLITFGATITTDPARMTLNSDHDAVSLAATYPSTQPDPEVPVVTPLRVDAVDLSHHNTVTADGLAKAKAAGVKAVWHKCTEGTTFTDAEYANRRALAKSLKLPFGAYHFARPGSSAGKVQAQAFLTAAQVQTGDVLPMLDLEDRAGLSRAALTGWVKAFVDEVVAQVGVSPIIYTSFDLDAAYGCALWVARYHNQNAAPNIPQPWTSYAIRQFSNGVYGVPASVPGLGAVDLDQLEVPLASLTIPTKPAPAPPEVPVSDDRYDRVTFHGKTVDKWTQQALQAVEADLGYELTITQGSYNAGKVSASAGTHDGGGVVDLAPWDWERKVRALRRHGFAAWHRTPIPNLWPEHIHAVQAGNVKASLSAQRQVAAYTAGKNGLANNGPDDGPRIPLVLFKYEEDDMPFTEAQLKDIAKAGAKAALGEDLIEVPADWSDKDKAGQKVDLPTFAVMVMKELVRQRNPKGTV